MGHYTTVTNTYTSLVSHTFHSVHTFYVHKIEANIVNDPITVLR